MAELTQRMIENRLAETIRGAYAPDIPGVPGIVFVSMDIATRGKSSRVYSSKLMELHASGEYYAEALLPAVIEQICKKHGIDPSIRDKRQALQKKMFDSAPEDLLEAYDQLTDEEVALLPPEEKKEREKAIRERGQRIAEFVAELYTEEEKRWQQQIAWIDKLEEQLRRNTAEHHALKHQMDTEIQLCARKAEDETQPYFNSVEEFYALPKNVQTQIYMKWKLFRDGFNPDFFSQSL